MFGAALSNTTITSTEEETRYWLEHEANGPRKMYCCLACQHDLLFSEEGEGGL